MLGVWYALEAILAGVIIVVFLITMSTTVIQTTSPQDVSIRGYEELRSLDQSGELRQYAVARDIGSINSNVSIYGFNHSVQVCDTSNNCTGAVPEVSDVFVSTYIISGDGQYEPFVIRLFIFK